MLRFLINYQAKNKFWDIEGKLNLPTGTWEIYLISMYSKMEAHKNFFQTILSLFFIRSALGTLPGK